MKGLRVKNDFGYYVIDGESPVKSLLLEGSSTAGNKVIYVNKKGVPLIAVKDGAARIEKINMVNDVCQSISIYCLPFINTMYYRIYSDQPETKSDYGLSIYNSRGEQTFNSDSIPLSIDDGESVLITDTNELKRSGGFYPINQKETRLFIPNYTTKRSYRGDWLVLNGLFASFSDFLQFDPNIGIGYVMEQGGTVYCFGIKAGFVCLNTNRALMTNLTYGGAPTWVDLSRLDFIFSGAILTL